MLETPNGIVRGEEGIADKEHKFQKWAELDCPAVAISLGVFVGTQAEV